MTSQQRVIAALKREQPDRIPHFEWAVDRKVREVLCPGCSYEEFVVRMEWDAILTAPDFRKEQVGPDLWKNEWGITRRYTGEEDTFPISGPIKTMEDFKRYTPPDPHAAHRYKSLDACVQQFKGKKAIGVHLNDVFSVPRYLMGFTELMEAFFDQPELVDELVELSVNVNIEMAKEVAKRGADFVFTGDDYAATKQPFMSPSMFKRFMHPGLKRVMQGFKDQGLLVIKHCDGQIWPIIDMMLEAPFDCLDPIDPVAGMDIGEVKKKFGHRVALKGNVNCAETLTFGSISDVIAETKQVIAKAAPGGGFILSSGNSIHSSVKPENYLGMLHTLRMYGRYPLNLEHWAGKTTDGFWA
ncbi:MAG TPA: uroporphyrinogen decarboxylase family protein [Planctomycetota bacterium]